ncbi:MAG: FAD-linked oxidase C-terminal domain-containing protein [Pseudomonadota bacterium]
MTETALKNPPQPVKHKQQVRTLLEACLLDGCLISDAAGMRPYECDGLTAIREQPWLVALPETEAQAAAVLRICREYQVPVVPRGAGTGLSGGARPHAEGVVLSLAKLNRIVEIDPDNCVARVQPGVRNLAISEAAAEYDLYYAPDPSSQIACSIGGNVAENSGGVHCLKYGLTVHNVCGVRVLTSEGEFLDLGGALMDTPGLDLLAVLCGSEGLLGLITEVTVNLLPRPPAVVVMLAAFAEVGAGAAAVADIIARGIIPAGMEMMDRLAVSAAEQFAHAGYPLDAAAILLIELDGSVQEVADLAEQVSRIVTEAGATDVQLAERPEDQQRLWKGRKSAFPAVGRLAPDYYCMDGTIPRHQLARVLQEIEQLSAIYNLPVANVFHAGDGNLHPLILFDANIPGQLEATEEMGGKILELCVRAGGTVTGEHGVGVEKLDQMCVQFAPLELAQFFHLKAAWDPSGVLNPGKGVPTLTRCGELGGMHVRHGQLPFADLERF